MIPALKATDLLARYRARALSPVEVATAMLDRIEKLNPKFKAFCFVAPEDTLAQARASEGRWMRCEPQGLLDGVPVSIKDLILTRDWPSLRGSETINPAGPWNDDAPVTERIREHGAVFIGKTTTPEFGWKGTTDSPLAGITRNPWHLEKTAGGASGGAAVAVALDMGPLAIATDGGGSIRIPASFTGLFGFKPSFGRVPSWPLSALGSFAHIAPITSSVADAALALNVMSLPDDRDWDAMPRERIDWLEGLEQGVKGLRIAWSPDLGYADVDPEIEAICAEAVKTFSDLGAHVEEASPGFENPERVFRAHWFAGYAFLIKDFSDEQRSMMDPRLVEMCRLGAAISTTELLEAQIRRGLLGAKMNAFHQSFDLLVTPTVSYAAFDAEMECPPESNGDCWIDWTRFTYPFNLTRQPAATVPYGFTKAGLPVGLQIVGRRFFDVLVLRASRAFEKVKPIRLPDETDR